MTKIQIDMFIKGCMLLKTQKSRTMFFLSQNTPFSLKEGNRHKESRL